MLRQELRKALPSPHQEDRNCIIIYGILLTLVIANKLSCLGGSVFQHLITASLFMWRGKYSQALITNTCPKISRRQNYMSYSQALFMSFKKQISSNLKNKHAQWSSASKSTINICQCCANISNISFPVLRDIKRRT